MHYFIYIFFLLFLLGCSNSSISIIKEEKVEEIQKRFDTSKIYDGYAFNVYINNQKVSLLDTSPSKKSLENYTGSSNSVVWGLEESISTPVDIRVEAVDNLTSYIGYLKPDAFEVKVFPLQKVHLSSKKQVEAREDVLVNGSPLLTQISLLEDTKVPSGEYVLSVKVRGTENWDRKEIYLSVKNEEKVALKRGLYAPFTWYTLALGKHKSTVLSTSNTITLRSKEEEKELKHLSGSVAEYKEKRDFSKALLYQTKLTMYYEDLVGKESLATADMYSNQALLHKDLGEYEQALKYNQQSLDIKLKSYPKKYEAISVNYDTMGIIYYHTAKYAEAIKYLKKSLELRESYFPEKDTSLADSYNNIAIVFERIGNHKEALENLNKALKIRKETVGKEHELTASVYSAMGSVYESLERYEKAKKFHKKSIGIHEKVLENKPKTEALASAYGAMGALYHRLNKYRESLEYYMKMLTIRERLVQSNTLSLSEVYNNIGVSYMYLNMFKKSKLYLEKSIAIKKGILGEDTDAIQQEYKNLGWLYFRKGSYKEAYAYAKKSVEMFLDERDNFFTVLDALEYEHFIKNNQEQMDLLFQCTYYLGDRRSYEDSFSYWLKYKGTMLENQNRLTKLYSDETKKETQEKIKTLKKYQHTLSKFYQRKVQESNEVILSMEIKEYKEKIKNLKEDIFSEFKPLAIDFKALTKELNSDQLYIDFARIGDYYFGFAVGAKGEIFFRRIPYMKSKKIDKAVLSFRKGIRETLNKAEISTQKESTELYDILLKTLLEKLAINKTELIISADGMLRLLPFEALFSKKTKQYLVENKKVQYIPSGREFLRLKLKNEAKSSNKQIVVFADPDFDESSIGNTRASNNRMFQMRFSKLKGTKAEARRIKSIMRKNKVLSYEGVEANEKNLFEVKRPKVLHIATHGFLIKSELSNPMLNAGLALTGANSALRSGRGEGVVTALKLASMDLQGTELVVLSACETGLIARSAPDSVSLLSKAFMQAGANAIIASLWSVSDDGTKELMELFYKEVEKGLAYDEALKKAKMKMIEEGVSPAIWSAFVLNGNV